MTKRPLYNGYEEAYMSGLEIKKYLSDAYETFGRHHSRISSTKFKMENFHKVKDDTKYRVFFNDDFFKIMDGETDSSLYFIGYTKERPSWAKD